MNASPLFTYYDAAVYAGDAASLHEGQWLSDSVLGFYSEYLAHEVLKGDGSVLLLKPSQVQLLMVDFESMRAALPRDMEQKRLVLAPINNQGSRGGSHWSLLVCHLDDEGGEQRALRFHYFDSMANANYRSALLVKQALDLLLQFNQRNNAQVGPMLTHSCPQQENSYDCGVFVILFADLLVRRYSDLRTPQKRVSFDSALRSRGASGDIIQRSMSPFAPFVKDYQVPRGTSPPAYDMFRRGTLRAARVERVFWWIDYGDLCNPNVARTTVLNLVNQYRQ
ncbi:hypothetical protein GGF46_002408 [Coemansia sp. RSA 552]|nr:hypothetical protein GGF46_002408 [Coemansia sp. RSA 552]